MDFLTCYSCSYYTPVFLPNTQKISYFYVFFEKDHSFVFYFSFSEKRKAFLIIQEIPYYSIIYFGDTIFSEHLEKKTGFQCSVEFV